MKKRTIALGLEYLDYTGLCNSAQTIHDGMQRQSALFPSPFPTLSVFQACINILSSAITAYGKRGSVGGTAEKAERELARDVVRTNLRSYANYVMAVQPDNPESWTDVGFVLKKEGAKTGIMEAVQDLHQFIARNIPQGKIKLKWKRPLNAPKATIITYKMLRSVDEHFDNAVIVGTTVNKATFIDTPGKAGVFFFYWVIPVTTAGDGVRSEICRAFASPV